MHYFLPMMDMLTLAIGIIGAIVLMGFLAAIPVLIIRGFYDEFREKGLFSAVKTGVGLALFALLVWALWSSTT